MSDECLLHRGYEVNGGEYDLWCDRWGNWTLVRDGQDFDHSALSDNQINRIRSDVDEFRAR